MFLLITFSHDVAAPVTVTAQEVTCYGPGDERVPEGEPGHMPLQDTWRIEVCFVLKTDSDLFERGRRRVL
jgi:hypothetical protein